MLRFTKVCMICCLISMAASQIVPAQDRASSIQRSADDGVASLRTRVEAGEAQIDRLQKTLERQSALLEQQQRLLEDMQRKLSEATRPALVPAALTIPGSSTSAVATSPGTATPVDGSKDAGVAKPKVAQSVETGNGKIRFNGLVQGWYAAGNGGFHDTMRVRRAELKFVGAITPRATWTLMLDPAKALSMNNSFTTINGTRVVADTSVNQASRILQDAFITLDYIKGVHVNVGQFKIPISLEGLQSSAALETVERALFLSDRARGGAYGDVRDIGLMINGQLTPHANFQLGMFNGSGENQNDLDKNDQKAVAGRLVVRPPFIKGLQIGGSGVWGDGAGADRVRRDRFGAELLFVRGPFMFKSELMAGKDDVISRRGFYTHAGYRVRHNVEPVFRFDSWDPNTRLETNSANVTERDYIFGVNYYITENNVKLQFNYSRKTFGGIVPSRNFVLANLQTSW